MKGCAEGAVTKRQWPRCLPTGTGKREGCAPKCVLCAGVQLHSRTSALSHLAGVALPTPVPSHIGSSRPTAPCVARCTMSAFCLVPHCLVVWTALHCVCPVALHLWAEGSGLWKACITLPHHAEAMGSETRTTHSLSALGQWALELLQCTALLPWGSGRCTSCNAQPHCLGVVGSATPEIFCLTSRGQWQWNSY